MIRSEQISRKIFKAINIWLNGEEKLIIGIDGYSGSGKSTILDILSQLDHRILTVHMDDFIKHWSERKRLMEGTEDKQRVFELDWYRYDELEQLLLQFKRINRGFYATHIYDFDKNDFGPMKRFDLSKQILVMDGIFLFHPEHEISNLWDRRIYLVVDVAKGDKRRVMRERKKWGKSYIPEDHSDSYVKAYRTAYLRYMTKYKPEQIADLVIKV